MAAVDVFGVDTILQLPPMLWGFIRWRRSLGHPSASFDQGFRIKAEEHTPTEYRALGGGKYEPVPGTGIWKTLSDAVPCWRLPDQGEHYVVGFNVPDVHVTVLDGSFRVTPTLNGRWATGGLSWLMSGYRRIEPYWIAVRLPKDDHVRSIDFEVVRRSWLFG